MTPNSSIDQNELKKFSPIAGSWWNLDGEWEMLHKINPIRLNYVTETIKQHFNIQSSQQPLNGLNILDVGCGGGLMTVPLHKLGANIIGIDPIDDNIKIAKEYASAHGLTIDYLQSSVEELIKQPIKYDVVVCLEVIEHVANPNEFVKNLSKLVKPKGALIISTINRNPKSYALAILMAEYVLGWVPKHTHDYNKFLKPSELNIMLRANDLKLKELKGLTFNLLTQIWQLSCDIDVNYFAYAEKI